MAVAQKIGPGLLPHPTLVDPVLDRGFYLFERWLVFSGKQTILRI